MGSPEWWGLGGLGLNQECPHKLAALLSKPRLFHPSSGVVTSSGRLSSFVWKPSCRARHRVRAQ